MMKPKKRKRLTSIVRHVRRPPCVCGYPLKCIVDKGEDLVSIETPCRKCGFKVVLACGIYPEVLAWVDSLRREMRTKVHEMLGSTQRRKAIAEVEGILGKTNPN